MKLVFESKETIVWVFLVALTLLTALLSDSYNPSSPDLFKLTGVGLVLLAFFKVRFVVMYFMEISNAPILLRLIMDAWAIVLLIAIVSLYSLGW